MSALDLLYRIAVADVDRVRREQQERDFLQQANDRLQRGAAEAWLDGRWKGAK